MTRRVRGDREVARSFRRLAQIVGTPTGQAARYALQPTLAEARRNAREIRDTGALARSLTLKKANRSQVKPVYHIGPRADHEGPDGRRPVKYAHLAEWGVAPNADGSGGQPPRFWLTRAFEATTGHVLNRFRTRFHWAMGRHVARLRARGRL